MNRGKNEVVQRCRKEELKEEEDKRRESYWKKGRVEEDKKYFHEEWDAGL